MCAHIKISFLCYLFQGESDALCGAKARAAVDKGITVIACIGETLEEREGGTTNDVLSRQMAVRERASVCALPNTTHTAPPYP